MFRLVVTGRSIKELAENARKFIDEANSEQTTTRSASQIQKDFVKECTEEVERENANERAHIVPPATTIQINPANHPSANVDSRGIPWDERIHSASMAITKTGAWRSRRGVEDSVIKQIENELKAAQPMTKIPFAPVPTSPTPLPVVPLTPQALHVAPVIPQSVPTPTPYQTPAIVAPPPLPPLDVTTAMHTAVTFKQHLVQVLADLVNQGKLTPEYIAALNRHFGVDQIYQVNEQQASELFEQLVGGGLLKKATY